MCHYEFFCSKNQKKKIIRKEKKYSFYVLEKIFFLKTRSQREKDQKKKKNRNKTVVWKICYMTHPLVLMLLLLLYFRKPI